MLMATTEKSAHHNRRKGFYSYKWKPDIDGKYTVYAKFGGSESYWPSQATTAFAVDAAAPTATPQPAVVPSIF